MTMQNTSSGFIFIFIIQIVFLFVYGAFVEYDTGLLPLDVNASVDSLQSIDEQHKANYPRKFSLQHL